MEVCLTGLLWLMTTRGLMKACKSKGKYFNMAQHRAGARLRSSLKKKKERKWNDVPTQAHISLMFDLRLLISPFQLAFVRLFVVLGVYYAPIIICKERQTRLWVAMFCRGKQQSQQEQRTGVSFVGQGILVILFFCISAAVYTVI